MTDASAELRTAIYTALSGHLTFNSQPVSVYSYVAHDVDYPYVVIQPISSDDPDYCKDTTTDIHDITIPIEVITGKEGDEQSYDFITSVVNQIIGLLVKVMLPMTSYNCLLALQSGMQEFREQTPTHEILRKQLIMRYIVEHK